jgi:hypothetical protein
MFDIFTKVKKYRHYDKTICRLEGVSKIWLVVHNDEYLFERGDQVGQPCRYCNRGNYMDADGQMRRGPIQAIRQWVSNKYFAWVCIVWGVFMLIVFTAAGWVPALQDSGLSFAIGCIFALAGFVGLLIGVDFLDYERRRLGEPYVKPGV